MVEWTLDHIDIVICCLIIVLGLLAKIKGMTIFKKVLIIGAIIFAFYLFSNTPLYFYLVDLSAYDTCEEFRKAPLKAQTKYVMDCECLTEKLSDVMLIFELEEEVQESFYNRIIACTGSEKIGELYRMAAKEVASDIGKKVDIKKQLEKWMLTTRERLALIRLSGSLMKEQWDKIKELRKKGPEPGYKRLKNNNILPYGSESWMWIQINKFVDVDARTEKVHPAFSTDYYHRCIEPSAEFAADIERYDEGIKEVMPLSYETADIEEYDETMKEMLHLFEETTKKKILKEYNKIKMEKGLVR